MLPNETDQEPKTMKANEGNLQLYARANAPSRDYYGLTITGSFINLNIWKVSYGPHTMPKQRHCSLEDFRDDKVSQDEIRRIFGEAVFDYVLGLAQNRRKLENLPPKLFLHILGFLRIEDILRLMCCSKIICELCNHEHVWKLMFMKKFGRQPSKEEKLLAIDSSWREVFKRRLLYVRKALRDSAELKIKTKLNLKGKRA
ncbi:F-box only protein 36-like [Dendroctonus ponderosae]